MTKKQERELKVWEYFIPDHLKILPKTERDVEMFFEWSERGMHKDLANPFPAQLKEQEGFTYFQALVAGKQWAGRHIHEMWEPSYLSSDGSWMGYYWLVGGYPDEEPMPKEVVDFIKKEMFKGVDAEWIESCYQQALEEKDEVNREFKQLVK